jgi:predicted methyltransferase
MNNDLSKISFENVIEDDSERKLYEKIASDILVYLKNNGPTSFNVLNKYVGGSDRRTLRLLDEMVRNRVILFENNMFMTPDYNSTTLSANNFICNSCNGRIAVGSGSFENIIEEARVILASRPRPTFVFDQRPVTFETTISRVAYAIWRNDIRNMRMAILGDDDLTSIPLALTRLPLEVVVFEIDKRLVTFINNIAKQYKLRLKALQCDLTKPISTKYHNYFDVFMCDPTPTRIPFTIFVNQGIELLIKDKGVGYVSMYSSCLDKNLDLQVVLNNMRVLITDMIPYFTDYAYVKETYSENDIRLLNKYSSGVSHISFNESLVRFEVTHLTKNVSIRFSQKDILGKATKRIMKNPSKDPAIALGSEVDRVYLLSALRKVEK